jgi:hypothetical protein
MVKFAFTWAQSEYNQRRKSNTPKSITPCFLVGQYPNCGVAKFLANICLDKDLPPNTLCVTEKKLIKWIIYVIENSYCRFDDKLFKIVQGFPIGTNNAPELANLYLLYFEITFFNRHLKSWRVLSADFQLWLLSYMRFIDDIFVATDDSTSPHTWLYRGVNNDGIFPTKLMGANEKIF